MKINLINNIRFAYNKDYHDKLHQKLARQKNDLPLAQQLSAADESSYRKDKRKTFKLGFN